MAMTIKEAMREVRNRINRYEREGWELFSYQHKGFMYQSEAWQVLKTSKSVKANLLISSVVDRLCRMEDELYKKQEEGRKMRKNTITAIKVIKDSLNYMGYETEDENYDNKSLNQLEKLLNDICNFRNNIIEAQQMFKN